MADTRTIEELAAECWQAMNACNLVAVLNTAADSLASLRKLLGDWQAASRHPIAICWADKIAQMVGGRLRLEDGPDGGVIDVMYCYHQVRELSWKKDL